jgi:hypothetical protein
MITEGATLEALAAASGLTQDKTQNAVAALVANGHLEFIDDERGIFRLVIPSELQ